MATANTNLPQTEQCKMYYCLSLGVRNEPLVADYYLATDSMTNSVEKSDKLSKSSSSVSSELEIIWNMLLECSNKSFLNIKTA